MTMLRFLFFVLLAAGSVLAASVQQLDDTVDTADEGDIFKSRIVGGKFAKKGKYPYLVSLSYEDEIVCGGTILDRNTILTAATCVDDDPFQRDGKFVVKAGDHKTGVKDSTEQILEVRKIKMHETFENGGVFGGAINIAILKLKTSLKFNEYVKKIQVVESKAFEEELTDKNKCFIAGYGYTENSPIPEKVKHVAATVRDRKTCSKMANDDLAAFSKYQMCTYDEGKGPCLGDNGAPLICYDDQKTAYQVGIRAFYSWDCNKGFSIYTRLAVLTKWLKQNS